jgi:CubicO group peptidase (beta-lactamase class C family)
MFKRRHFIASTVAVLFAPRVLRAQTDELRGAVQNLSQLHSIQILRGRDMLFADAPRGAGLDKLANIKSCSKSVVALLLGAAIDRGEIAAVTARLGQIAPKILPQGATQGTAEITMEDLVTLRAGLERTSGANYGNWVSSRNWLADALTRPMVAEPGGQMLYSTGSTHILGAALAEATGLSLLRQARERLGDPLGIEIPGWTRDPQGYYLGGNEMALRPTAMLKIAALVRDDGRFEGQQIVSKDWIMASRERAGLTRSRSSGLSSISGSIRWRELRLASSTVGCTASIGPGAWWMANPIQLFPASVAPTCAAFMNTIRWTAELGDSASMISRM